MKVGISGSIATLLSLISLQINTSGWPEQTVAQLTLRQKIGQLIMVSTVPDEEELTTTFHNSRYPAPPDHEKIAEFIQTYQVGGIFFVGKDSHVEELASAIQHFQALNADGQPPLFIALDAEWGPAMRLRDAPAIPQAMTLGALSKDDDHLITQASRIAGQQCKQLGIHMNLAPVVDISTNPNNPIGIRSFGEDAERVTDKALLFSHGLRDAAILSCAKHFPGHGNTSADSHDTLPHINATRRELNEVDLKPYRALIEDGIDAIMTAHVEIPSLEKEPGKPASMSYAVVTDLLRDELNFDGLIISDSLVMDGAAKGREPGEAELRALRAGNDILLGTNNVAKTIELIEQAVSNGAIEEQEIDQHVLRILRFKEQAIINQKEQANSLLVTHNIEALNKQLFARAVTLVKNEKNLLPLKQLPTMVATGTRTTCPYTLQQLTAQLQTRSATDLNSSAENTPLLLTIHGKPQSGAIEVDKLSPEVTGSRIKHLIQQAKDKEIPIIAALFASPYALRHVEDADAIIIGYEDAQEAHEAVCLALIGQLNPRGILPVTSGPFQVGTSLHYDEKNVKSP